MPTSPQHAAGIRIDPMPSLPCAAGTMPAATLPALPPDEPPGVRSRFHGLWVRPNTESVAPKTPQLGHPGQAHDHGTGRPQPPDHFVVAGLWSRVGRGGEVTPANGGGGLCSGRGHGPDAIRGDRSACRGLLYLRFRLTTASIMLA